MNRNKFSILFLSVTVLVVLVSVGSVHAAYYYFILDPVQIQGGSAYVPSFKLDIKFSFNTGSPSGIVTSTTRQNTAQTEKCDVTSGQGTCWGGGYDAAFFHSDSVNRYDFTVTANYSQTINETIQISITSHGQPAIGSLPIHAVANYVKLHFIIQTELAPNDPSTIAAVVDQKAQARDTVLLNEIRNLNAKIDAIHQESSQGTSGALDQYFVDLVVLYGVVAVVILVERLGLWGKLIQRGGT